MPATAAAKSLQSCLTLCDPIPGILRARTLEWVAISFSNAWKWKVKVMSLSHVRLFVTPWTAAYQAPLSMGFSRQEYWSGVSLPSPSWMSTYAQTDWAYQIDTFNTGSLVYVNYILIKADLKNPTGPQICPFPLPEIYHFVFFHCLWLLSSDVIWFYPILWSKFY